MAHPARGTGGRGRPRDHAVDERLFVATVALIESVGYEGFTIEAVAARAAVAKSTIYRRYPAKADLVLAAVAQLTGAAPVPDQGSLGADLASLVEEFVGSLREGALGSMVRALQLALAERPDLADVAAAGFLADRKRDLDTIIDRAVARGELPSDVDREIPFDLCFGGVLMRFLVMRLPISEHYAGTLVATVLDGYRHRSSP